MDTMLVPVRMATSKTARQTYLNVILFVSTSTILWGLAVIAYIIFYIEFMPHIGIERTVHLQYGQSPHPYGLANLDSTLITEQAYDITLTLTLPRSPSNLAIGNFMISLSLLSQDYKQQHVVSTSQSAMEPRDFIHPSRDDILFHSRRPAILTYSSELVTYSERLAALPLYVLGLRKEAETLVVPMAESVYLERGRQNVPESVFMQLQAGQDIQVYSAVVHFTARLAGLRWFMYYQRVIAFFVGTTAFWVAEMVFALVGWLVLRSLISTDEDKNRNKELVKRQGAVKSEEETDEDSQQKIKEEEEMDEPDLSDTPRTFPTYGRSAPLRYIPQVKNEEDSEEYTIEDSNIPPLGGEADDEGDGEEVDGSGIRSTGHREGRSDSGIGTSFSEGGERAGLARRRSRGGRS
ncbi:putative adipose-regulatory protein-domain-containing protein [Xylogone sp. PMI_703]|nr:putative adipose-regulatory protein-domain-containing protein [Xylogone sp. PMI_703]